MTTLWFASGPEAMAFVAKASAATVLVGLTLLFQSAGMAALIHWIRTYLEQAMDRFGAVRSGVLMVRFTSVIIALHLLQILLWACILSLDLFFIVGACILLLGIHLFNGGLWRPSSAADVAILGRGRKCHRRADVWTFRWLPVCDRNPAR